MFNERFSALVSAPKGKLKDKKGNSARLIEFKLRSDFTQFLGSSLDKAAKAALVGLQERGLAKVEIPIDTVAVNITLSNGSDSCEIVGARGIKVAGKANLNKPEDAPVADIHWRFNYEDKTWQFLGRNFGSMVDVVIVRQQLSLVEEAAGNGKASTAAQA